MPWFKRRSEEETLKKSLEKLVASTATVPGTAYTFDRLRTLTGAQSNAALTLALQELVSTGKLRTVVRVESPSYHGGIADFKSLDELPDEIEDWRTGHVVEIKPRDIRVLFAPAILE